jgi:chromosome segregation ATPase
MENIEDKFNQAALDYYEKNMYKSSMDGHPVGYFIKGAIHGYNSRQSEIDEFIKIHHEQSKELKAENERLKELLIVEGDIVNARVDEIEQLKASKLFYKQQLEEISKTVNKQSLQLEEKDTEIKRLSTGGSNTHAIAEHERNKELEAEIERLNKKISNLENDIVEVHKSLADTFNEANYHYANYREEIERLKAENEKKDEMIKKLVDALEDTTIEVNSRDTDSQGLRAWKKRKAELNIILSQAKSYLK